MKISAMFRLFLPLALAPPGPFLPGGWIQFEKFFEHAYEEGR
jgi:hypothetical protein